MKKFFKKAQEIITGECTAELRGRKIIFIDGCRKVLHCDDERASVLTLSGEKLSVSGKNLRPAFLADGRIAFSGLINEVKYE